MESHRNPDSAYREATRDAELGVASCRFCPKKGPLGEFITVFFGGGLLLAVCKPCMERGHEVRIRRGERGIEVLGRQSSPLAVSAGDLDVVMRRPK